MRHVQLAWGRKNRHRLRVIVGLALTVALAGLIPRVAAAQSPASAAKRHRAPSFSITLRRAHKGVFVRIKWAANCHDRGQPFTGTATNRKAIPLRRGGTFRATATFTGFGRDHAPLRYQLALSGTTGKGGGARGTFALTVAGHYARGASYSCATGTIRWRAKSAGANRWSGGRAGRAVAARSAANPWGFTVISRMFGWRVLPHVTIQFTGRVTYEASPCLGQSGPDAPVSFATLRVYGIDGDAHDIPIDANGRYNAQLSVALPAAASVVLDNARIFVRSAGLSYFDQFPYAVPAGVLAANKPPHGVSSQIRLLNDNAALASIFETLDTAARVAGPVSPVPLGKMFATFPLERDLRTWRGDTGTFYSPGLRLPHIVVGSRAFAFDTWDLLHEYGHYVLNHATGVDPDVSGTAHHASSVFPNQPVLPWLEGWADAFATIVSGNPRPMRDCQPLEGIDLSAQPAQPRPDNPNLAQYNEIATAGALIGVADVLDSGNHVAGMGAMLSAFHQFPPHSTREARDALIKAGVENAGNHDAISSSFNSENIRWLVTVRVDDVDNQTSGGTCFGCIADNTVQIVVDGPYGRCQPPPDGGRVETDWFPAFGDIPWTNDDDCYISGSDGNPPPKTNAGEDGGNFSMELPFKNNGSHLDPYAFIVSARWLCTSTTSSPDQSGVCTQHHTYHVTVDRATRTDSVIEVGADINFSAGGGLVPIAAFDGQGRCKLLIPAPPDFPSGDCSA